MFSLIDLMFISDISKNITTFMNNIKGQPELHCWLISPQNISVDKVGEDSVKWDCTVVSCNTDLFQSQQRILDKSWRKTAKLTVWSYRVEPGLMLAVSLALIINNHYLHKNSITGFRVVVVVFQSLATPIIRSRIFSDIFCKNLRKIFISRGWSRNRSADERHSNFSWKTFL